MREIKFRGQCGKHWVGSEQHGKWVHGDLIHATRCTISNNSNMMQYFVDEETVGQFTGLKDKNCIEIYEGDILLVVDQYGATYAEVKYKLGSFYSGAELLYDDVEMFDCKVVGNIYENQDLLAQQV